MLWPDGRAAACFALVVKALSPEETDDELHNGPVCDEPAEHALGQIVSREEAEGLSVIALKGLEGDPSIISFR